MVSRNREIADTSQSVEFNSLVHRTIALSII
jgi:hypothetical protein